MMKLLSNALSPYGRKVKLTIALKGLGSQIEMVSVDTNPGTNVEINSANPLGKIPALVLDDKTPIFDSNVICEYLDSLKPAPVLFPKSGPERWKTLVLAHWPTALLDAALLLVYEKRFRPEEKWHAPWQQRQQAKIDRALDQLEKSTPSLERRPRLRPSHACLCPRLSRFPARRQMACRTSQARGLARSVRQGGAGLRRHKAKGIAAAWQTFQSRRHVRFRGGGRADMTSRGNPLLRSLFGVKRTSLFAARMFHFDPKPSTSPG